MHRPPFLLAATLLQTVLAGFVWLSASPAEACSPFMPARDYFTLAESLPADGATDVLLDDVVLLTPRRWETQDFESDYKAFDALLTVTVQDTETGESVPGVVTAWSSHRLEAAWRPTRPLSPNRRYALVATLNQTVSRPAQAEGPTELRMTFTTGSRLSAPLELLGGLEVSLEEQEVDTYDCDADSCGPCEKDGTERVPHARVKVPGIRGGALPRYDVSLHVTDRTPLRFDIPISEQGHVLYSGSWGVDSSGAPTETLIRLPKHDASYPPCFSWQVKDAAGRVVEGAPVCLDEEVDTSGGFLGCSAGPGSASGTVGVLLLMGLAVTLRSRRRLGS